MSYFSFENEVSDLLRLDAPISKGPAPRWQRKSMDARSGSTTSTPLKNTSHLNKTPSKTPKSIAKKTPKTPSEDRFIPNRASMNFELNYYKMVSNDENEVEGVSPSKAEFKKNVSENLCGNDLKARILSYKNKAPTPREGSIVSVSVICENYYNEKDKRIYRQPVWRWQIRTIFQLSAFAESWLKIAAYLHFTSFHLQDTWMTFECYTARTEHHQLQKRKTRGTSLKHHPEF